MLARRRILIVALLGLVIIACAEIFFPRYLQGYDVAAYQHYNESAKEYKSAFRGIIGMALWDGAAIFWLFAKSAHHEILSAFTIALTVGTVVLAFYTARLWDATVHLGREARKTALQQAEDMRGLLRIAEQSARAAQQNADAAISGAAPFLHPRVVVFDLHPTGDIPDGASHIPRITLAFENIGRTPAIMRGVRATLRLVEDEHSLPEPPPIADPVERSDAIAPGEIGALQEWSLERSIDAVEIRMLIAKAKQGTDYLRFYAFGFVVFEDVFNSRTTRRFCIKLRQNRFQAVRGGQRHNAIQREKNPDDESEGAPNGEA